MGKCTMHRSANGIFDSTAEIICHQVNCRGVMGAGIAKEIKTRVPTVFKLYQDLCASYASNPKDLLGFALVVETNDSNDKFIANLFAQDDIRKGADDKTVYTDYNALAEALDKVVDMAVAYGVKTVAVPLGMGCGLAGGDWNEVKKILKASFQNAPVDLEIWGLPK